MATIVRNTSGSELVLEDFGITLAVNEERDLEEGELISEIADSDDLKTKITNGDVVINDGIQDLTVEEALKTVTVLTQIEDEADDSSGAGWEIGSSPPASPLNGYGWFNTNDSMLYTWDETRGKWLTPHFMIPFSYSGYCFNLYLGVGVHNDPDLHFRMHRPATICAAQAEIKMQDYFFGGQYRMELRVNKSMAEYSNFPCASQSSIDLDPLDVDLNYGDRVQAYITDGGGWPPYYFHQGAQNPFVSVEVAWRYDP
jgi:hypothetical protein